MALFAHQAVYLNIIDVPNDVIIVRLWRHETSSCSCNLWFHRMWAWIYVTSWIFILLMSDFNYMDNLCIKLLFQHYSLTARTTFIPGTVWTSLFCLRDDLNISCLSQGRLEHLIFVAGTTWKSHFCCGDDLNISLLLRGRLEHFIIVAGTTWTSYYCCRDDLNLDDRKELTQTPEDQWFSKEKLYKVNT